MDGQFKLRDRLSGSGEVIVGQKGSGKTRRLLQVVQNITCKRRPEEGARYLIVEPDYGELKKAMQNDYGEELNEWKNRLGTPEELLRLTETLGKKEIAYIFLDSLDLFNFQDIIDILENHKVFVGGYSINMYGVTKVEKPDNDKFFVKVPKTDDYYYQSANGKLIVDSDKPSNNDIIYGHGVFTNEEIHKFGLEDDMYEKVPVTKM